VELESHGQLQQDGKLQRAVRERLVAGLSQVGLLCRTSRVAAINQNSDILSLNFLANQIIEVDAKHRVTPPSLGTLISLSLALPISRLPTPIQSPTIASPLPCAIELNLSNVQHTHPAPAPE
jgi:hypothetical protein